MIGSLRRINVGVLSMSGRERREKQRKTIGALDREAAHVLDQFYLRLRSWALKHNRPDWVRMLPTWADIQAARVLVRMKSVEKDTLYDAMDRYFANLNEVLEARPVTPSFTHFLDTARNIL